MVGSGSVGGRCSWLMVMVRILMAEVELFRW
jgi:hypothetical protein